MEKALAKLFNREIKIKSASGRTDSGVHAFSQVVNFQIETPLEPSNIRRALNRYLPPQIAVREAERAAPDFHARYDAKSKIYEYRIWNHPVRSPLNAFRTAHIHYKLDPVKMRKAARVLVGRHDFRSFCASNPDKTTKSKDTVRTVKKIRILKNGALIRIAIEADGFLYHMARNIVGTLLEVGSGKLDPRQVEKILHSRDRKQAGRTAPAQGLTLLTVGYEDEK